MPIATLDKLIEGLTAGERLIFQKNAGAGGVNTGAWVSFWKVTGTPGAGSTPPSGAGAAPTDATAGAMAFTNPVAPALAYLAALSAGTGTAMVLAIVDRLVHTSGLSGTSVAAQTVNSTALTRYTTGVGVEAYLEWYTATGSTARTATISYTNQAGTAGRTGTATIPASAAAGRMMPIALQAGDTGVRSVESVTLSGTTGTAGDFGVTLVKRLVESHSGVSTGVGEPRSAIELGLPQLTDDACLALMAWSIVAAPGPVSGGLQVAKA